MLVFSFLQGKAQSPHGTELKMDCTACHNTDGWEIPASEWKFTPKTEKRISSATGLEIQTTNTRFNHYETDFPLLESHQDVDCRACHETLVFDQAQTDCFSCHIDVHSASVGNDCIRCHTSSTWLVDNIPELHEQNGFPLVGAHATQNCVDCHMSETQLRFDPIGNDCVSCHLDDFNATDSPDHKNGNFSMNCLDCHDASLNSWNTEKIDHDFFPLTEGHEITDCRQCHLTSNYSDASPNCVTCHQVDYDQTEDPNHTLADFGTDCVSCHTTALGWEPAKFSEHDAAFFPIYSGSHDGVWQDCFECHTEQGNLSVFACITCHTNPETDNGHQEVSGYVYEDNACLACHPSGDTEGSFDHNSTNFPLTGAHLDATCLQCHAAGFEGTSTSCIDCHTVDFESTQNPDHLELGIPTDCANCHTTDVEWMPATFDMHDEFYILQGAHAEIANDCVACHAEGYNNTPATCVGCHQENYDNTTDPKHSATNFSTDCASCHTENAWEPSTFDHDAQYFPIYSGSHNGEWSECIDCHTNANNFAEVSCTNCHTNPQTDNDHNGISGYSYQDQACLACHPTGTSDDAFDHNSTNFPLTGEHMGVDCLQCHANGYAGTSTNCVDCHNTDYQGASNPNHNSLNISTDCIACHTTEADWMPANFANHDDYYALNGAHAIISNDCVACHNGDYNNTPNDCVGCHQTDFDNTTSPNHTTAHFGTDCVSCHTENAWEPATFDHDAQYFPIYSGSHNGEWSECIDCHTNTNNFAEVSCTNCHTNPQTDNDHNGISGYSYQDQACLACHPTGTSDDAFDHNATNFPLTGEHIGVDCLQCHANGYAGTSTNCVDCHNADFQGTINPNHNSLNISTDCIACHTTEADWMPANFAIHDNYYALNGAHAAIANDCVVCHNGDYNNTPNTCVGCHQTDFNNTTNPDHTEAQFPTDCAQCHSESAWEPSTFDHNSIYPLNGAHASIATNCAECHSEGYTNTPNTCVGCHQTDFNNTTNPDHTEAQFPMDCAQCHSESAWEPSTFDHNSTYPLNGAHATIATNCIECHSNGYTNTPNTCVGCHQTDFNNTTNPDHADAQFPTDCAQCHSESAWEPSTFDHNSIYPLNGAHARIATNCAECHSAGYTNTPNTCVGCHQTDFDNTSNPDHAEAQFPTDCAQCHSESAWAPSTFDHNSIYPLNGAHANIATNCVECHSDGYTNTPNTCIGCHQTDYNNTNDPNHSSAQFPTDCTQCHTESAWQPSTFDHDGMYFPIYSGKHKGEWNQCVDCHSNSSDYSVFTCINCHEHSNKSQVDNDHSEVNGYQYNSTSCYTCHPTGDD
jgi:hypothetical protein